MRELFDVAVVSGVRHPAAIGFMTDEIRREISIDGEPDDVAAKSRLRVCDFIVTAANRGRYGNASYTRGAEATRHVVIE